jgi:cytochrome c
MFVAKRDKIPNTTMKKALHLSAIAILMMAANYSFAQTQTKKVTTDRKTVTKTTTVVSKKAEDIAQGKELISKADCLTCHKVDGKLVGPPFKDIAKKYPASEANYALLTKKVTAGGSGNWGAIAMAPHPNIPAANIKKMVTYILSVK